MGPDDGDARVGRWCLVGHEGGKFGHGFVSAAGSAPSAPVISAASDQDYYGGLVVSTVIGGSISSATGGTFANGAASAAMMYSLAEAANPEKRELRKMHRVGRRALNEANKLTAGGADEYGGLINRRPDGSYAYTTPLKGSACLSYGCDVNLSDSLAEVRTNNGVVVADYHTHPYAPGTAQAEFSNRDIRSLKSTRAQFSGHRGAYVASASGWAGYMSTDIAVTLNPTDFKSIQAATSNLRKVHGYVGN